MTGITPKPVARQRGAVLVEMALVTPILLILLLATGELTRAFIDHNTLTKAVRNGARYVAANAFQGTTGVVEVSATLENEAKNLVVYGFIAPVAGTAPVLPGLTLADITVLQIVGTNNIQVSATYAIVGILGPTIPNFFGGSGISTIHNLRAEMIMRAL